MIKIVFLFFLSFLFFLKIVYIYIMMCQYSLLFSILIKTQIFEFFFLALKSCWHLLTENNMNWKCMITSTRFLIYCLFWYIYHMFQVYMYLIRCINIIVRIEKKIALIVLWKCNIPSIYFISQCQKGGRGH